MLLCTGIDLEYENTDRSCLANGNLYSGCSYGKSLIRLETYAFDNSHHLSHEDGVDGSMGG